MAGFVYRGLNAEGATVEGRITAADETDALRQLESQSIAPFRLTLETPASRKFARKKARPADRHRFIRQLAVLLRAGAPLLDAFETVSSEEPCRDLALEADGVRRDLRAGSRLSVAMKTHMDVLPDYAPRLIELGEATGQVPKALSDIATQMEHELKSAAEIRNALAYPAFLAVAGGVAVVFMFLFIVPRFAALIGDDRTALPALSRIVIGLGVTMRENLPVTLVILLAIVGGIVFLLRSRKSRAAVGRALYGLPVVGSFLRSAEIARWARTCATALSGGAPLLEALILAEGSLQSPRRRQGLAEARRAIRAGEAIDVALRAHTDFDAMTINLVRTGRASASLDEMLAFLADLHEEEARNRAKRLTALAEPMAVLFIASVVGLVVVSLVLAMTSLYDVAL
ncbi:general secretion pathway protein GspF [Marinicauda pacifica]|jgi:general secretion pathway protein F|uniref:Type II secretion system F family protein n=1 Tax=Marinicauda pacifica TaxID=1133559 RepID=A0A4S2H8F1_9PROT|nr:MULTISPECIES: type II secretion system F family protein [Marinicauda]TGY92100.1 type II secretion system F family protein [Marinicauda pacifica]GGE45962.1 general secretion pathway protein GspF [Marinicauda pacifica]